MRRITIEEPFVRAAGWSRAAALFALVVAAIGVVMAREGVDPTAVVAVEVGAVLIAGAAILFAAIAAVVIWRTGYRGTARLITGLLLAAILLAYPGYLVFSSHGRAPISDVSTDLDDPPMFSHGRYALAARGGVPPGAPAAHEESVQRSFYPDLQPLMLDTDSSETFHTIAKIIAKRHWRVITERVPLSHDDIGVIEAVAGSTLMGFPVDVVIRIRPQAGQTQVDIRSVSRSKWHAPDSDPRRVQALADDIDDQSGDE